MMRLAICACVVLVACSPGANSPASDAGAQQVIEKTSTAGPVKATVSVTPASPKVGDVVRLVLEVEAASTATVTMPPYGEALGRFKVVGFPKSDDRPITNGRVFRQTYELQPSGSGAFRIPALRIEFTTSEASDAGPKTRELLTEEIPVTVESVLPAGALADKLSPALGPLDESPGVPRWVWIAAPLGGALLALVGLIAIRRMRAGARERSRVTGFERAAQRLRNLESRDLPDNDTAESWYVELSDIVRRYIEDATGVRAPELTTEEFLREAHTSSRLSDSARALTGEFLELCDRVKFAGYIPPPNESKGALDTARKLIDAQEKAAQTTRAKEATA